MSKIQSVSTSQLEPLLWINESRGVYIPQAFALSFRDRNSAVYGVDSEQWAVLEAGPDHEDYWEVWDEICTNATVLDGAQRYTIHEDGDCWLIPEGMEWDEDEGFFIWPKRKPARGPMSLRVAHVHLPASI